MIARKDLKVVEALLESGAHSATKYLTARRTIRATRRLYRHNGRQIKNERRTEILITIGEPNYLERDFIKKCKRAGEPFPVRKIELKFPPKLRAK